jgi:hypothetical protein
MPSRLGRSCYIINNAIEDNGMPDKEATSYNDILDAFRLALRYYTINKSMSIQEKDFSSRCLVYALCSSVVHTTLPLTVHLALPKSLPPGP